MNKNCQGLFCSNPFESAVIDERGDVYLCCQSWLPLSIGNLLEQSWEEVWNSEWAQAIRGSIHDGTYTYCQELNCPYLQGQEGRLKPSAEAKPEFREIIEQRLTAVPSGPSTVTVSYDPTCNLACPSCRCGYIVIKGEEFNKAQVIHEKVWGNALDDAQILFITGMGDPFSSRLYRQILREFEPERFPQMRIRIVTNGLLLTPGMWESISASHSAVEGVSISVNAGSRESFEINQQGGDWEKLLANLEFVAQLRRAGKVPFYNINYFVHENNFREMKAFVELGQRLGVDMVTFANMQNWGTYPEEEFAKVAVHLESHPLHGELREILKDPIFREPIVRMGNLSFLLPGQAPLAEASELEGVQVGMGFDEFARTLLLDEGQREAAREILDALKDEVARVYTMQAVGHAQTPVEYLAELQAAGEPGDSAIKFGRYVSTQREQGSGLRYLELAQGAEELSKSKLDAVLAPLQVQAMRLAVKLPLQNIETGHAPLAARVAEVFAGAAPVTADDVEGLTAQLGLDEAQAEALRTAARKAADAFVTHYFSAAQDGPSPGDYLVSLLHAQDADAESKFGGYVETKREGGSGKTYPTLMAEADAAARMELREVLTVAQWRRLEQSGVVLFSLKGYDPFGEEVKRRLHAPAAAGAPASLAEWLDILGLDAYQREQLRDVMRLLREEFAEIYVRPSASGGLAPMDVLAKGIQRKDPQAREKFVRHAAQEIDAVSGVTYVQALQAAEQQAKARIRETLDAEQAAKFAPALAGSLLDVQMGEDPFGEALRARLRGVARAK